MTIDEMISKIKIECKEQKDSVAYLETQEEYAYYIEPHRQAITACEQLAEWLEDYKRINKFNDGYYKAGYTKGIEDFVTKLKEETFNGYATLEDYSEDSIECVAIEDIVMIAEQLKEGSVKDET